MLGRGFEWFVAWRHLRDQGRRSRRTLATGLLLLVLGAALLGVAAWLADRHGAPRGFLPARPPPLAEHLRLAGIVALILGGMVSYLGALFAMFTVFTAISVFGVFLGTAFPIIALSIMSGFEADLKAKIRGSKADVVITRVDDEPFEDWRGAGAALARVPGVVASTPYIETEVMLMSGGSPYGVVLRGIDPATAASVFDFGKGEARLADLSDPGRVARATAARSLGPEGREEGARGDERDERDEKDEGAGAQAAEATAERGAAGKASGKAPRTAGAKKAGRIERRKAGEARRTGEAERTGGTARDGAEAPAVDDLPTILVGGELYDHILRVYVGSEVLVVCPLCNVGPTGPAPKPRRYRVAGHFRTGMYEYDAKLAYVDLADAQRFLGMRNEVTGIDVRTSAPERAQEIARAIAATLGPRYEVRSWQELNKSLFMALRLEKIAMFVVLAFIALVASFSIVANLIMLVTEKAREVAMLKAMGARDGAILRVFFAEGLYIGLLGLAAGVTTGVIACVLMARHGLPLPSDIYYMDKLPVVMRAGEIATVAALALLLCFLATVYPALLASRMRPVEGLRYE